MEDNMKDRLIKQDESRAIVPVQTGPVVREPAERPLAYRLGKFAGMVIAGLGLLQGIGGVFKIGVPSGRQGRGRGKCRFKRSNKRINPDYLR